MSIQRRFFLSGFGIAVVSLVSVYVCLASTACSGGCEMSTGGLRITCEDAVTSASICNATMIASTPGFSEQLTVATFSDNDGSTVKCRYVGSSRAGTYDVVISAAGYQTQTLHGIVLAATSDGCGVSGASRDVTLAPDDAGAVDAATD